MDDIKRPAPNAATDVYTGERRRTQRVQIAMPVLVRGKSGDKAFEEEATTISISANGCMVMMSARLVRAQEITLLNPKTVEELPCTVAFLGRTVQGKTEVAFEFSEPSPLFWRIAFPPEDWDPAERKRPPNHAPRTGTPPRR
jgi:PilZ domain-containing protein